MRKKPEINRAVLRSLAYLVERQQDDGSFISFSSPSPLIKPPGQAMAYRTTFVQALMLASLSAMDAPEALPLRDRLAKFLLDQKSPAWSFNYWPKDASQRETHPYPDDLDDTFCALSGLFLHDPAIIKEEALAAAVKLLLAAESTVGGPYRTWLVSPDSKKTWLDVDLAVNSNIAYFLSLAGNGLPNLDKLMDEAIQGNSLQSPYYPSTYPLIYFMSRAYGGSNRQALLSLTRDSLATAETALDQALCLIALVRLGETRPLDPDINRLLAKQSADGSWPAAAFCIDPTRDKQAHYNGSAALTTAFAIEALWLYSLESTRSSPVKTNHPRLPQDKKLLAAVRTMAKKQCQSLGKELAGTTLAELNKLAGSTNGPEIITLPYRFNQSLVKPLVPADPAFFTSLGLANLYGWVAYTIYDDFLDGEGQPELLPAANVALRHSLDGFLDALPDGGQPFQKFVRQTFNDIDGANAWEIAHCRFNSQSRELQKFADLPNYGNLGKLAERSLGHILAPLAVLLAAGYKIDSQDFKQTQKSLFHYLIARQLNDDAHDWETDFNNGHTSYVVAKIMSDASTRASLRNANDWLPAMRKQFWHNTLLEVCQEMQQQIDLSRSSIHQVTALRPVNVITKLLDSIEDSLEETRSTQSQARNFLKHYSRKVTTT